MSNDWETTRNRLNLDVIAGAADTLYAELSADPRAVGVVEFAPGDATGYRVVVVPATRFQPRGGGKYLVSLATGFGMSYEWMGTRVEPYYVAEKWSVDARFHTGVVMTELLNALAERLAS